MDDGVRTAPVTAGRKPITPTRVDGLPHLAIECVSPDVDGGRFPIKRIIGDVLTVGADILKDGHDLLAARVRYRSPVSCEWRHVPMAYDYDSDRWTGHITLDHVGRWTYTVDAWTDVFASWRDELQKKVAGEQDVSLELREGAELVDSAARRTRFGDARTALKRAAAGLVDERRPLADRVATALSERLLALMHAHCLPSDLTTFGRELAVVVDRERARYAAWYEMFPRSFSPTPGAHGTFADAERALPRLAELGFNVVYLPPIHPIGVTGRKGANNSLQSGPDDPGSPWAIGNAHGGHFAVDPRLGTLEDFDRFVARAAELGLEVALDYALQCSPDHPWLAEHPDWFFVRPDGTLKYAENPPKKYQDIYPLNFWCEDREALWRACREIIFHWIGHGVRTFRVDNPHTKPFAFWEWLIAEVKREYPDVIFLSEAFTRPKRLKRLAKLGFTQSYTYFTWRTEAWELREYLTELTTPPVSDYLRGNLFVNTPDILHEYLQTGGRAAFRIRLHLAATLSPLYGIYSGFELMENVPLREGSEEYLDSEKYQIRQRDFTAPDSLDADIARINRLRETQRALQLATNLTFHVCENDRMLFYSRHGAVPGETLLVAITLDPHVPQETTVHVPIQELGIGPDEQYVVEDLLTGARFTWRGARNYVRLDPAVEPAHVLRLARGASWVEREDLE
ncbi:MAG TPA: alpha-1,4-glucan--maltose-1-phosphate maltosyltransferase [Gemmatimonadaceae bacterium]|nr:alpha-1,4-glucan--maltose-1-phosphate maltosyltransferase [Gemmatimonadaceae bacterium]